jgi:hypothetical protein
LNVNVVFGDSLDVLWDLIKSIYSPVTFWLDGHYSNKTTLHSSVGWSPLLYELDIIKKHKIKNHTILIDDIRCFSKNNGCYKFDANDIVQKLLDINPLYNFSYENGYIANDVLVAKMGI